MALKRITDYTLHSTPLAGTEQFEVDDAGAPFRTTALDIAKTATQDAINDAVTDRPPSQNAVFDALALKQVVIPFAVAAGTADALTADFTPDAVLVDGGDIRLRAAAANTGAATLAVDGGAALAITKQGGTALAANDIAAAGHELQLRYRSSVPRWELMNPKAASATGDVVGPASATDMALAAFDTGTGKLIQERAITVSDVAGNSVTLATTAGNALSVEATAPAATTGASQAGKAAALTASDAVASTDTAGAAAGGAATIEGGAAARNTSGNADGGNVILTGGAGIGTGVSGQLKITNAGSTARPGLFMGPNQDGWSVSNGGWIYSRGGSAVMSIGNGGAWLTVLNTGLIGFTSSGSGGATFTSGFFQYGAGVLASFNSVGNKPKSLLGGGAAVASAAAMPLPTGRVFHVTGTTNITSITSTNFESGVVITLIFDDVLTFTDGGNLVLAGNFVTAANSTITLAYDGTNWFECSRSTN